MLTRVIRSKDAPINTEKYMPSVALCSTSYSTLLLRMRGNAPRDSSRVPYKYRDVITDCTQTSQKTVEMLKVLTVVFALAACSYGRERLASATALIHRTTIPSPEFLHAMLDCWNRFSRPSSPHDCIPFPTALPRFVMNDMNHIQAIKGTGIYLNTCSVL